LLFHLALLQIQFKGGGLEATRPLESAYFVLIGGMHPQPQEHFVGILIPRFISSGFLFCFLAAFAIVITSFLFKYMRIYLFTQAKK